jgi:hypothetical protein
MFPVAYFPVADDFAAISKRLKEIEWEAAMETAAAEFMRQRQLNNEREPTSAEANDDMGSCA